VTHERRATDERPSRDADVSSAKAALLRVVDDPDDLESIMPALYFPLMPEPNK
jgi:hypothetical protein